MEFSVLMSVYAGDRAAHVKRAIESVTLDQEEKPTELVLVKDGPVSEETDACLKGMKGILKEAGVEFVLVEKETNAGLAAALNTGLSHCRYDYVARMDADDIALPRRFAAQVAFLAANPGVSVLGGSISEFTEEENGGEEPLRVAPVEHEDILAMMRTRNAMNHMTVMYKKADILALGGYSEDFGKLEDYKLWVDAITAGLLLHNLPDVLVRARVGAGFIERRSNKREIYDWDMLQRYLLRAGLITKRKAFINRAYIRAFIYMPGWMKKIAYATVLRRKKQ